MGTDMRMHVERRVNGQWVYVPAPFKVKAKPSLGQPEPCDWYYDQGHYQSYEEMSVLADVRNFDHFPHITPKWRGRPPEATAELTAAMEWICEGEPTWLTLDEIKRFDFDQLVQKPARWIQPDELARLGWLGNGDGTPYQDIVRRDLRGTIPEGYTLTEFPVRQFVGNLLSTILPAIEAACDNAAPEDIRLTIWFW